MNTFVASLSPSAEKPPPAPVVIGETQLDSAKPPPRATGFPARAHGGGIVLLPDAGLGDARPYEPPLPRGELACLIAIAQHEGGVTRQQLTVLTGYKRSTRDAYLQRLRERRYVTPVVTNGRVMVTDAGKAALGVDYQPLPTGKALRDYWLGQLPEGGRRGFRLLFLS